MDSNDKNSSGEFLRNRITSLSGRVAHLQSIKYMYDSLSNVSGLYNVLDRLAKLLIDMHGGSKVSIYYILNETWYVRDLDGSSVEADIEDDPLLKRTIEKGESSMVKSPEDSDSSYIGIDQSSIIFRTSYFPLLAAGELIGVVKFENMGVPEAMINEFKTFFQYAALMVKSEINNLGKIEEAYNELEQIFNASPAGMIVVDISTTVIRVNRWMLELLGEDEEHVIGKKYTGLFYTKGDSSGKSILDKLDHMNPYIEYDTSFVTRKGDEIQCIVSANQLRVQKKLVGAIISIKDITDRKNAEIKLRESLTEKEILLKEVHHRVKNNLQIISSLISLQSSYIDDENVSGKLRDLHNRISSMAVIHEKLYGTMEFSKIDFSDYLETITRNLVLSYETDRNRVKILMDVEDVHLDLNSAIPCGLIINEIVSNSLKYAFPDYMNGEINLRIKKPGTGSYILTITDNGIGMPEEIDFETSHGLGMELISVLVKQLKGKLSLERDKGTRYIIEIPG